MFALGIGRLIVLFPLLIAAFIVARRGLKVVKSAHGTRKDVWVITRAAIYTFVACFLLWVFPVTFGVIETITGLIVTSIMATIIVICVVDLPPSLSLLDHLAWREWKGTPYVRWARRICLAPLILFLVLAALFNAVHPSAAISSGTDGTSTFTTQPTTPAQTPTSQATATAPTPSATATTPAPSSSSTTQFVANNCSGPSQIPTVDKPSTIPFGTGNLQICNSGRWQWWSGFATTSAPSTVQITAWVITGTCALRTGDKLKPCGYGQVVDTTTGDSYIIRTTDF